MRVIRHFPRPDAEFVHGKVKNLHLRGVGPWYSLPRYGAALKSRGILIPPDELSGTPYEYLSFLDNAPHRSGRVIRILDIWRGFAIFGILFVNISGFVSLHVIPEYTASIVHMWYDSVTEGTFYLIFFLSVWPRIFYPNDARQD